MVKKPTTKQTVKDILDIAKDRYYNIVLFIRDGENTFFYDGEDDINNISPDILNRCIKKKDVHTAKRVLHMELWI